MEPIYAATILLVAFAVGEYVNVKSEARLSAILTTSIILIALFWMGCPAEIMTVTGFGTAAATMYSMTMVNMGTMVQVDDMLTQWRTLLIGFVAVCDYCADRICRPDDYPARICACGRAGRCGRYAGISDDQRSCIRSWFQEAGIFGLLVLLTSRWWVSRSARLFCARWRFV